MKLLEKVNWLKPQKQVPAFVEIGIAHNFGGIEEGYRKADHLKQVHETTIVKATADQTGHDLTTRANADGLFTTERDRPIAVRSADCLPILYCCKQRSIALAVHSGWRSLVAGIPAKALKTYEEHGGKLEDIVIALGPCISLNNFEVGPEVKEALYSKELGLSESQAEQCFKKGRDDRWHVDLKMTAAISLINYGVTPQAITIIDACTFDGKETWHSYRREGEDCEMNWSWIKL